MSRGRNWRLASYTDLYDFSPVGYLTLASNGTIAQSNLAAAQFLGSERAGLLGKRLLEFIAAAERSAFMALLRRTSTSQQTCELRLLTNGQPSRWVQLTTIAKPSVQEVRVALVDISERKLAEEALREREFIFQSLYDSPGVMRGIVEVAGDNIVHIADNIHVGSFFGCESLDGKWASELGVPIEIIRLWLHQYEQSRQLGRAVSFEYLHPTPDGGRWLCPTVTYLGTGLSGRERFAYAVLDISDRKKAEEVARISQRELGKAHAALEAREAFFRTVVNSLDAHIAVLDRNGIILEVNEAWQYFARCNDGPVIWLGVNYLEVCQRAADAGDSEAALAEAGIRHVIEGRMNTFELEYPCHSPRKQRWFFLKVTPLHDNSGGVVVTHSDITQPKQIEQALTASEKRFHDLLNFLPVAAYTCAPNGLITYFNQQAVRLWGRIPRMNDPLDRFHGAFKLVSRDGGASAHEQSSMARALQLNRFIEDKDIVIERPDGTRRIVMASAQPIHDASGTVLGGVCVLMDITSLRESEEMFGTFMRFSPTIAFVKSVDDRLLFVNKAFEEQIWDGNPPDWFNRTGGQLWPPEMARQLRANDQRILASGQSDVVEESVVKRERVETWMSIKFPFRQPTGEMCLGGMALNITELRQAQELVRRSEERFRGVVEASPTALIITNQQGRIVLLNAQAEKLFGFERVELLGQPIEILLPERYRAQHGQYRQEYSHKPMVRAMGVGRDLYGLRKDGSEFPVEVGLSPFKVDEGLLILTMVVDITKRKHEEVERERMLECERRARDDAETARRRFAFLAESSRLLSASPDPKPNLARVALLAVPYLADWCIMDLREEDGVLHRFAPDRPPNSHPVWVRLRGYGCPIDISSPNPLVAALTSGKPSLASQVDESVLLAHEGRTFMSQPDAIRRADVLVVPLRSRVKTLGVMAFVSRSRRYQQADLTLAEDLGRRATHAIDNANLLREAEASAEALRALASQLSAAEDKERRRLALDIHDTIGQNLTAIKLNLESATKNASPDIAASPLNASLLLLDETIETTRSLTFDLYPTMLDDLGLSATLRWYLNRLRNRVAIEVEIEERGSPYSLPTGLASYLYRAIKELLNNVTKHAHARLVVLSLIWKPTSVRVLVTDDGVGFTPSLVQAGLGIISIRERVTHMGGSLAIESIPRQGTQVILELPLKPESA